MLAWALTFLAIAIVAGLLGATGVVVASAATAQVIFVVCLMLFSLRLMAGLIRRTI